ncbi:MAG: hypothetical protein KZY61_03520 [Clostridiaceae bacterium]|nr:hypothetical protein [Clostridiaceae bacterium]MBW4860688.1 hypothetical protein [Clostridiaceae bacterium]MBW4867730.1 hypothetical protein [Clostridiaceae bacterium]
MNIISLYYFLKIILFIYNPIDIDELNNLLKYLCTKKEIEFTEEEINIKIESIMHWLQKERYIKKIEEKRYELTREGILEIQTELYGIFGTKVIDNYRVQVLNYQLRIKDKIS